MDTEVLQFFGIDPTTLVTIAVVSFALIEGVKAWLPENLLGAAGTRVLSVLVTAAVVAIALIGPAGLPLWAKGAMMVVVAVVASAGIQRQRKKMQPGE